MKTFVINLERRQDKLERIKKRLQKYSELDYEIFCAIDGQIIDNQYMEKNGYKSYPNWYDPNLKRKMTKGEIGCSLSHWNVWKIILEKQLEYALIIEDDAEFTEQFSEKIKLIPGYLKDNDLIYLGRKVFNTNEEKIDDHICKPNFSYWTVGYAVSLNGVKKLVDTGFDQKIIPVDEFLPYMYAKNCCKELEQYNININIEAVAFIESIINPESGSFIESDTEQSDIFKNMTRTNSEKKLHIVTVATYKSDGYYNFMDSLKTYGLEATVLGLDGEDRVFEMLKYPGGGFKVNLFKDFLKKNEFKSDDLILFTDCFDVIFNDHAENIIRKYNKFSGKIVFAAEIYCWPDKSLIDQYTPPRHNEKIYYQYLNSGGFIGLYKDIYNIFDDDEDIKDTDDDQLYYTKKYLSKEYNIILDRQCEIFQTLNGSKDVLEIQLEKSHMYNTETTTVPSILHGNGGRDSKIYFNQICNYLPNRWSECYGYKKNISKKINAIDLPTILIIYDSPEYLHNFEDIDYPSDKLYFITFANLEDGYYVRFKNCDQLTILKNKKKDENKIQAICFARDLGIDYCFFIDSEHKITNPQVIQKLLRHEKEIIAPILTKPNMLFSNFWGDVDKNGYYARSFDYIEIGNNKRRGCWNIAYLNNTFLLKSSIYNIAIEGYGLNDEIDIDMKLSYYLREKGVFMFVENIEDYGFIKLSESESSNSFHHGGTDSVSN